MKRVTTIMTMAVIAAGLALTGCTNFSGAYETANGVAAVAFKSGKAYMTMMGETEVCDYDTKGDKIIVHTQADPNVVFTRNEDGTIDGPLGNMKQRKS